MPFRTKGHHGVTPQGRGRFAGFDVLARADQWDQVTAGAVLSRLALPAGLAYFTPAEVGVAKPMLDLLLAQDGEPRVPVLAMIDARLAIDETDGWHYDDMPEDGQAWRDSLAGLDADAHARYHAGFAELDGRRQARLLQDVQDLAERGEGWHGISAGHIWSLWTRFACTAFYSHPWAWNEIGFPGPAYPRGYLNPGINARESFEVDDRHSTDPVPFAGRVERARRFDDDLPDRESDG